MNFCDKLQALRKSTGLSQDQLAEQMNVSRQAISKWESGGAYPNIEKAALLCNIFAVTPDTLFLPQFDTPERAWQSVQMLDESALSKNIRRIRSERGIRQEMLAELLDISRQSISKWESGSTVPKLETLIALCAIFNTTLSELFYVAPQELPTPPEWSEPSSNEMIPDAPTSTSERPKKRYVLFSCAAIVLVLIAVLVTVLLILNNRQSDTPTQITEGTTDGTNTPPITTTAPTPVEPTPQEPKLWDGSVDTSWYDTKYAEYTLTDGAQLAGLARLVNNGKSFANRTIKLGADIYLNNDLFWTPIGRFNGQITSSAPVDPTDETYYANQLDQSTNRLFAFDGTFDGNGYTVHGLHINGTTPYIGLFAALHGGTVKNVKIDRATVTGGNSTGILCGIVFGDGRAETRISNCTVSAKSILGTQALGGIVGKAQATEGVVIIENCSFDGYINSFGAMGGICGAVIADGEDSRVEIHSCQSAGTYQNSDYKSDSALEKIGGIVGYAGAVTGGTVTVFCCVNRASVCPNVSADAIGGIVGGMYTEEYYGVPGSVCVSRGVNLGRVGYQTTQSNYVGGIVGYMEGTRTKILESYNRGEVWANLYCGGICGFFRNEVYEAGSAHRAVIRDCAHLSSITSTCDSPDLGNLNLPAWANNEFYDKYYSFGGIVGRFIGDYEYRHLVADNCYVNGDINAPYKGAIIGQVDGDSGYQIRLCEYSDTAASRLIGKFRSSYASDTNCVRRADGELTDAVIYSKILTNPEKWDQSGEYPLPHHA